MFKQGIVEGKFCVNAALFDKAEAMGAFVNLFGSVPTSVEAAFIHPGYAGKKDYQFTKYQKDRYTTLVHVLSNAGEDKGFKERQEPRHTEISEVYLDCCDCVKKIEDNFKNTRGLNGRVASKRGNVLFTTFEWKVQKGRRVYTKSEELIFRHCPFCGQPYGKRF